MKRMLSIAATLLVAALFALPTAAIASLDGTEPVFGGEAGIVPLNDSIEIIGDPTDSLTPDNTPVDDSIDRSSLARDGEVGIVPISEGPSVQSYAALSLAGFAGLGLISLAALALSVIAMAKVNRMKAIA